MIGKEREDLNRTWRNLGQVGETGGCPYQTFKTDGSKQNREVAHYEIQLEKGEGKNTSSATV